MYCYSRRATTRVCSTREGTVFTGVCLLTSVEGTHFPGPGRGYQGPGGGEVAGCTPFPGPGGGTLPRSRQWEGAEVCPPQFKSQDGGAV